MKPEGAKPRTEPKPRVLILDDDALSNRVIVLALRMHGFPCHAVTREVDALAAIEEFDPAVVILEWADRMQRRANEVARIRAHAASRGRSVRIIVVTFEHLPPSPELLDTLDGYFTKPIMLVNLEEMILRLGDRRAE